MIGCSNEPDIPEVKFDIVTDENYALAETQIIFADYRDRIIAQSGGSGTDVTPKSWTLNQTLII